MPELLGDFGCIKATASAGLNAISLKPAQNYGKLLILERRKEPPVTRSCLQMPRCSYLAKSFQAAPACHSSRLQSTSISTGGNRRTQDPTDSARSDPRDV